MKPSTRPPGILWDDLNPDKIGAIVARLERR